MQGPAHGDGYHIHIMAVIPVGVRHGLSFFLVISLGVLLHSTWTGTPSEQGASGGPLSAIRQLVQGSTTQTTTTVAASADIESMQASLAKMQASLTEMQGVVSRIRTEPQQQQQQQQQHVGGQQGAAERDVCSGESWVLNEIDAAAREEVEAGTAKWYDEVPSILSDMYNNATPKTWPAVDTILPRSWNRFDVWMPSFPKACNLSRLGGIGDGGKWLCGIERIPASEETPCIVYSIGSHNEWGFEEAIHKETSCIIHTFDCTVNGVVPEGVRDRVTFHPICLGDPAASTDKLAFKSYGQIMEMLGHSYVTLLKADIEGAEWPLFHELLTDDARLPEQISFELHYETGFNTLDWFGRCKTAGEMGMLAEHLYHAGYRTLSREDNEFCPFCSEFTIARFKCPVKDQHYQQRLLLRSAPGPPPS